MQPFKHNLEHANMVAIRLENFLGPNCQDITIIKMTLTHNLGT